MGEGAVLIVPAVGLRRRRAWGWYTAVAVCMLALVVLVSEIRTILVGPSEHGGMYALMGMGFWVVLAVAALGGLLWAPTRRCLGVARRG